MSTKKRPGRPAKLEPKDTTAKIRCTVRDKERWQAKAHSFNMTFSEWMIAKLESKSPPWIPGDKPRSVPDGFSCEFLVAVVDRETGALEVILLDWLNQYILPHLLPMETPATGWFHPDNVAKGNLRSPWTSSQGDLEIVAHQELPPPPHHLIHKPKAES